MFTGIIEEKGTVSAFAKKTLPAKIEIRCSKVLEGTAVGDSIAVNGVCLTVTSLSGSGFTADIMKETIDRSSLGSLTPGSRVNLERAVSLQTRLGGHLVSGHIDGTGRIGRIEEIEHTFWFTVSCSPNLLRLIIEKGSIAIDGISLTVAKVESDSFQVSIIPHSLQETTLKEKKTGDIVNLENDILGKYVERLLKAEEPKPKESRITEEFLAEYGF